VGLWGGAKLSRMYVLTVEHVYDDGGAGGFAGYAAVVAAVAQGGPGYEEFARGAALGLLRLERHAAPA
jgi:hypothetical protein